MQGTKNVPAVLVLFFLLASISLAVILVQQRQEIRKEAEGQTLTCLKWSGGNYSDFPGWFDANNRSNPTIHKIHYQGAVSRTIGWKHVYWCDYRMVNLACRDENAAAFIRPKQSEAIYDATGGGYTPNLSELIVQEHFGGKCQVIQVDVTPCGSNQPFYVIYVNDECPAVTPTPTLPFPPLRCDYLTLSSNEVVVGTPITLSVSVSPKASIWYAKVPSLTSRCVEGNCQKLPTATFTPSQPGIYVFEANVYTSDCEYLCSVGQHLYQNPNKNCDGSSWSLIADCRTSTDPRCSQCKNGPQCQKYLTVNPEPLACTDLGSSPTDLNLGDEVSLICTGTSGLPIDHFDFRVIYKGLEGETTKELGSIEAIKIGNQYRAVTEKTYTLRDYGCYTFECRACTSSRCTDWGKSN